MDLVFWFILFFVSGGITHFKINLDTESVQGIWQWLGGDSAATDVVDTLVSELLKGKDFCLSKWLYG